MGTAELRGHLLGVPGWGSDHDQVDRAGREGAHRVHQHRLAAQQVHRLGAGGAEALAETGRRDDGRDDRCGHADSAAGLANTIRPLAVVSTLVTRTRLSWPMSSRDRSATTMVPSSR